MVQIYKKIIQQTRTYLKFVSPIQKSASDMELPMNEIAIL